MCPVQFPIVPVNVRCFQLHFSYTSCSLVVIIFVTFIVRFDIFRPVAVFVIKDAKISAYHVSKTLELTWKMLKFSWEQLKPSEMKLEVSENEKGECRWMKPIPAPSDRA